MNTISPLAGRLLFGLAYILCAGALALAFLAVGDLFVGGINPLQSDLAETPVQYAVGVALFVAAAVCGFFVARWLLAAVLRALGLAGTPGR